jgi:aminoglycoside phosphotransferase (APT) family kinase protein
MVACKEDQARLAEGKPVSTLGEAANSGLTEPSEGYRLDEDALSRWMTANVDGFRGPLSVSKFKGGQSNPTYRVQSADGVYVLRRKPPGLLVSGAHAVDREARVQSALSQGGFPVARIYGYCADKSVIGSEFYVMQLVEGRIFWDATFPEVSREDRPSYFYAMCDVIAQLHSISPASIGLGDYGKPGSYFARQLSRWSRQYQEDPEAGRDANLDRLVKALPQRIPQGDQVAIVHGDFRCDNLIFHPREPRIIAVLDWELSTLGHPLADFAYHAMMYRMPPHIVAGLAGADLAVLNIPGEADYINRYCRATGRETIPDWNFYVAFNFFRLAAIMHGIAGRALRGTASSTQAIERGKTFPELAELAVRALESLP